jgi:histidinol dehydrogenase
LDAVRRDGDRALRRLGRLRGPLEVPRASFRRAFRRLSPRSLEALELACRHLGARARREASAHKAFTVKPTSGVILRQQHLAVGSVGILVPERGVSVLLSAAIPAALAGVGERVVCTPASAGGEVDGHVLAAAYMADVTRLFRVGGAPAAAALCRGTKTLPGVALITGQGDASVAAAAAALAGSPDVSAELRIEGPGELCILGDHTAPAEFLAADLVAHAAHDGDAACLVVTTSPPVAEAVQAEVRLRLRGRPRDDPARAVLRRAAVHLVDDLAQAVQAVNRVAPRWLALWVKRPEDVIGQLGAYGTLVVGPVTPPELGRLVTGGGCLPSLGVHTFLRPVTAQQVEPSAYVRLSRAARALAELEGRTEVSRALEVRLTPPEGD